MNFPFAYTSSPFPPNISFFFFLRKAQTELESNHRDDNDDGSEGSDTCMSLYNLEHVLTVAYYDTNNNQPQ